MSLAVKSKKLPTHVKKRSGSHHRKSKQYTKTYWPYLPMLVVVALGFMINSLLSSHSHVLGASSNLSASNLLSSTNTARMSDHESALQLNQQLMTAAQKKADDMVTRNYWSHTTPDGKTPWTFITAAGYDYQTAGENLAYGFTSGANTVAGWMASPEHRANILNSSYQDVGFGIASSANFVGSGPETVIVAMYASPVPAVANINFTVARPATLSNQTNADLSTAQSQLVSRLSLLPGSSNQLLSLVVVFVSGIAMTVFVIRHGLRAQRWLVKGETFVAAHPVYDTAIVAIVVVGVLVTRTIGVIH